jgi:hypothetical protein
MSTKEMSAASGDTERLILDIAPERECLDWICYRVRGGVDPDSEPKLPAASATVRGRPERQDIAMALGRLVTLGLLAYDGGCWSMTLKGRAAT